MILGFLSSSLGCMPLKIDTHFKFIHIYFDEVIIEILFSTSVVLSSRRGEWSLSVAVVQPNTERLCRFCLKKICLSRERKSNN
ncbi:hypothetical protein VNO80_22559 [Phaseolus coccineus]|uniref:Uncharacterized protein n=1 Tax=Phaseolus coccineus TaxID=3886 RepID=A0AAN9M5X0_PHACN